MNNLNSLIAEISYATSTEARAIIAGVLMCIMALLSIAIIVVVLMQKSNQDDISSITGGSSDTYFNKNKEMSAEKRLKLATIIMGSILAVIAIVFFLIVPGKSIS